MSEKGKQGIPMVETESTDMESLPPPVAPNKATKPRSVDTNAWAEDDEFKHYTYDLTPVDGGVRPQRQSASSFSIDPWENTSADDKV